LHHFSPHEACRLRARDLSSDKLHVLHSHQIRSMHDRPRYSGSHLLATVIVSRLQELFRRSLIALCCPHTGSACVRLYSQECRCARSQAPGFGVPQPPWEPESQRAGQLLPETGKLLDCTTSRLTNETRASRKRILGRSHCLHCARTISDPHTTDRATQALKYSLVVRRA
jgi:hypothetical protein